MESISKIMLFVNQTLKESRDLHMRDLLIFAVNAALKLAFLYGLLWVVTRFAHVSIGG